MWTIDKNIATYKDEATDFTMLQRIEWINEGDGIIVSNNETIHSDPIGKEHLSIIPRAMRELGEVCQKLDMSDYTYRTCRWCGKKLLLNDPRKLVCRDTCQTMLKRLKKRIAGKIDELISQDPNNILPEDFEIEFTNGFIASEGDYSIVSMNLGYGGENKEEDSNTVKLFLVVNGEGYEGQEEAIGDLRPNPFYKYIEYSPFLDAKIIAFYPNTMELPIWRYINVFQWLVEKY
ncbi:hypothetical protein [Aquamicrobium sp.]|uniref:hypothetical protein n=1 Tax=Aquamicrobium sp. TaxID=1872579 RepID=UPI002584D2A4|nr:hypothetical protein [Aquamicrobium sp.]MCK9549296.1 hypothetical protein [Aquamicrobium sp.]